MKRKFVFGIALCLALAVTGCGKSSEEKQAANYYQKELGLDKEEAEELAHELYGEDELSVTEEQPEETVVEPLPELVNSEWYNEKVQIYDMVFSNDWSMTEEDVRKIVEGSAYDVDLTEDFDRNGEVCLGSLVVDGTEVVKFQHNYINENFDYLVECGLLDDGDYYSVDYNSSISIKDNCYDKASVEFKDFETREDVLNYLAENNFVEVKEQAYHYSIFIEPEDAEFADTPHYVSHGAQSIHLYRIHKISETDHVVKTWGNYSGAHLNLVDDVEFNFNTDGTIQRIFCAQARRYVILGELIEQW